MPRVLKIKADRKDKFEMQTTFLSRPKKLKKMPVISQLSDGEHVMVENKDGNFLVVRQGKKLIKYKGEEV